MILEVGSTSKRPPASLVFTHVWSFPRVSSHVHFSDVGRGETAATPSIWTQKGSLTWKQDL